jgi:ceramide glucosyltransferase
VIMKLLLALVVASWAYWIVAIILAFLFFRTQDETDPELNTPVSILKPVKGLDYQALENFASFCRQDYSRYELIFGVSDQDDPVIPVIHQLQQGFPDSDIRLVVAPTSWPNRKAGLLHTLASRARYDTLVISDSDMRVTPDYLRRVVSPLKNERVGLVTCLYKGCEPSTFTARLEALYMGAAFLPSVLLARKFLNMRFAMGATNALRRRDLARIGGFAGLADYLADDYQLGVRIADLGLQVHLSDYVVSSVLGATTFYEQWHREVRWSQCTRISRPVEYPGLLFGFSIPITIFFLLFSGLSASAWAAFATSIILRWIAGWLVTGWTHDTAARRWLPLLPLRDMLTALIWCAGAVGQRVVWRGEEFILRSDGRLETPPPADPGIIGTTKGILTRRSGMLLEKIIRLIDGLLLRYEDIFEFCHDKECILRLSVMRSDREMNLSDGTRVCPGDSIVALHFTNERMPLMPREGPDLGWALVFQRQMRHSLRQLAAYIENAPDLQQVKAFGGYPVFGEREGLGAATDLLSRWGFDVIPDEPPTGFRDRFVRFWQNLYTLLLVWAYNPGSVKGKGLRGWKRDGIWISRNTLLAKYSSEGQAHRALDAEQRASRAGLLDQQRQTS